MSRPHPAASGAPGGSGAEDRVAFEPVRVAIDGDGGEDGLLVFADGRLVALITRLRQSVNGEAQDNWFLEAGFGPCAAHPVLVFRTLRDARDWVGERLGPAAAATHAPGFRAGQGQESPAPFDLG